MYMLMLMFPLRVGSNFWRSRPHPYRDMGSTGHFLSLFVVRETKPPLLGVSHPTSVRTRKYVQQIYQFLFSGVRLRQEANAHEMVRPSFGGRSRKIRDCLDDIIRDRRMHACSRMEDRPTDVQTDVLFRSTELRSNDRQTKFNVSHSSVRRQPFAWGERQTEI
jgi:hypothetical protein